MIDKILKELWDVKDNIAKEHGHDLDNLVAYLQFKSKSRSSVFFESTQNKEAEQGAPADPKTAVRFSSGRGEKPGRVGTAHVFIVETNKGKLCPPCLARNDGFRYALPILRSYAAASDSCKFLSALCPIIKPRKLVGSG